MEPIQHVTLVEVYKSNVWIESDLFGARHVVVQHEGCDSFTYASFYYDYRYTTNAGTRSAAIELALQLGAANPVEHRNRELKSLSDEELTLQIEALQQLLDRGAK